MLFKRDIDLVKPGSECYSGIMRKVELAEDANVDVIKADERVVVSTVDVGVFRVKLI